MARAFLPLLSLLAFADALLLPTLPAARRLSQPRMILDNREEKTELNPVKIIATVIAQADIVGVQAPWQAPDRLAKNAAKKFPRFDYLTADVAELSVEEIYEEPRLPNNARREVDREVLHPLLKLADGAEIEPLLSSLLSLPQPALLAFGLPLLALLAPLVAYLIVSRKLAWYEEVAASQAEHKAAFDAAWQTYRDGHNEIVDKLLAARSSGVRDPLLPPIDHPFTVCVTMATGQEGAAVVKALSAAGTSILPGTPRSALPNMIVKALVRNPSSAKALELAKLPNVQIVQADSLDADSLSAAMEGADAAYLCTTLNNAGAGTWTMGWDGGKYEVEQGVAFAKAAKAIPTLKQIVYGTAPARKWPEAYRVEPPIHYAAKWRIEEILLDAGLPLTALRKCPYHENFTKLTKPEKRTDGEGGEHGSNWWQPGTYFIKALTPSDFEYNMLGPGDIGAWALLALENPSILSMGTSLSISADVLTGHEMAAGATISGAFGPGVSFEYKEQPRWLFEALAFVEPTFVYISGLQRWNTDGGRYDLSRGDVERLRALHAGMTWEEHLQKDGLEQFTSTMKELLPDVVKS